MFGYRIWILCLAINSLLGNSKQWEQSNYPYLSECTWACFSDWIFPSDRFDPNKVQLGDTIFIPDIDDRLFQTLDDFGRNYIPRISHRFILLTPRTDFCLPGPASWLLEEEKIAAWFMQNIQCPPSSKAIPVPVGLRSVEWGAHPALLDQWVSRRKPISQRETFIYINFFIPRHQDRRQCFYHFVKMAETTITGLAKSGREKRTSTYLKDLTDAVFVPSPLGNGPDCHRTWEALLMGCYPIVLSSPLNPLFENLPVVIVDRWEMATVEFLQDKYVEFQSKKWPREPLYAPYWFHKVEEIQAKLRECL